MQLEELKDSDKRDLGSKDDSSSDLADLLLNSLRDILGLEDEWVLWEGSVSEDLEVSVLGDVDDWDRGSGWASPGSEADGGWDQRPDLVEGDGWAVIVVLQQVVLSHSELSEVSRMVLVEVDSVVMLSSSITATSGMLSMLSNTSMSGGNVSSLFAVLSESGGHFF